MQVTSPIKKVAVKRVAARQVKKQQAQKFDASKSINIIHNSRITSKVGGDYTLENSELLFSAVSRIANALSAMPIQLYQDGAPIKSDLNDLLSSVPNPNMSSSRFIRALETCRCTSGNGYALKIYSPEMELERMDVIDPSRVTPIIEEESGELWYKVSPGVNAFPKTDFYIHNFYMIHVSFLSANGYFGVNPVRVLCNALDYDRDIQNFSREQLEQGINASIVLEAPSNLSEIKRKEAINTFLETYRETHGDILFLESGMVAKALNLSPVDSNLFEVEKITRSKMAMVYNIPPHLLGDYSDVSFASQEQQMLEFLMLTMLPIVIDYEQEFNRKLLTSSQRKDKIHWEFKMESILRADAATMADVNLKAIRSGTKTIDEVRASQGYAPLPNGIGNYPLVSQDLATLDYTVNRKADVLSGKYARNIS